MTNDLRRKLINDALDVWAPNYPRRVNRRQLWVDSKDEATDYLLEAEQEPDNSPFVSVYSFPDGHTKEGNLPLIDTLFIDFDFEDGDYNPENPDYEAWRRDISHLLTRVRIVAETLVNHGRHGWRASLSGHKGVHLFLDMPALEEPPGSFPEVVAGIEEYTNGLIETIEGESGIGNVSDYVDVTSSDLGRLCRVPNTRHGSASANFGEDRFCVPVTLEELATITVDDYIEYTKAPRPVPYDSREPNDQVRDVVKQHIRTTDITEFSHDHSASTVKPELVDKYREESNDAIELDDVPFLTSDRPCVWKYHEREDKFQHGNQSHFMELFVIRELIEHDVPIDVIKEFLSNAPEYNEQYTEQQIKEVISHDYERFTIRKLLLKAPEFSGYDDCALCQQVLDANPDLKSLHS